MKKLLAALLAVSCITLTACSGGDTAEAPSDTAETTASESVSENPETEAPAETTEAVSETEPPAPLEGEQVAYAESNTGKYIAKISGMNVYTMMLTLTQESGEMLIIMSSDGERVGARANDSTSDMSLLSDGGLIYTYDHGSKSGIITKDDGTFTVVTPQDYFGESMGSLLSENMAVTEQTVNDKNYIVESSYIGGDANDLISYWFDETGKLIKFVETYTYEGVSSEVTADVISLSDTHDEGILSHFDDYKMSDFTNPEAFRTEESSDDSVGVQGEIIAIEPAYPDDE